MTGFVVWARLEGGQEISAENKQNLAHGLWWSRESGKEEKEGLLLLLFALSYVFIHIQY